ncbi:MAG: hypothetical protein ACXVA9_01485 [Bdellovibrionales bacterium]
MGISFREGILILISLGLAAGLFLKPAKDRTATAGSGTLALNSEVKQYIDSKIKCPSPPANGAAAQLLGKINRLELDLVSMQKFSETGRDSILNCKRDLDAALRAQQTDREKGMQALRLEEAKRLRDISASLCAGVVTNVTTPLPAVINSEATNKALQKRMENAHKK